MRIIDFGLAEARQSSLGSGTDLQGQVGTLVYKAPEIFDPEAKQTRKVDVYAFAISMNELFDETRPYSDKFSDLNKVPLQLLLNQVRPTVSTKAPGWVQGIISSCWTQEANERPDMNIVFVGLIQQQTINLPSSKLLPCK